MTAPHDSVVVVGSAASGIATALNLRRMGHLGSIDLVGDETALPYDRPPLSKGVLSGHLAIPDIGLATQEDIDSSGITVHAGVRARELVVEARTVGLADGRELRGDAIVIATGARARRISGLEGATNVHTLRTFDDAVGLAGVLTPGRRLGVVGGGLIGLEVAASARKLGLEVTVIEPELRPLASRLGSDVAAWLLDEHRRRGVSVRLGSSVADFQMSGDRVASLLLADGDVVDVDEVLVAIGAVPNVEWLTGSGLDLRNGVTCDEFQSAAPGVYVVGDVANGYHPVLGRHLRMETRTNASEGALHLAQTLSGQVRPYSPLPFFWTDQFEIKVQAFGLLEPADEITFEEGDGPADARWIAVARRDGRLTAVVARSVGKSLLRWRRQLQEEFSAGSQQEVAVP